jgi:hypothetical protein
MFVLPMFVLPMFVLSMRASHARASHARAAHAPSYPLTDPLTLNHIHGAISSHEWLWNSTGSVQLYQVDCPLLLCVGFTQLRF